MSLYSDIYETEFLRRLTMRRLAELDRTRARVRRPARLKLLGPRQERLMTLGCSSDGILETLPA